MQSAMLPVGWARSTKDTQELIDVGWTSVWVHICTQWITAGLYVWILLVPIIFPDNEFGFNYYKCSLELVNILKA